MCGEIAAVCATILEGYRETYWNNYGMALLCRKVKLSYRTVTLEVVDFLQLLQESFNIIGGGG